MTKIPERCCFLGYGKEAQKFFAARLLEPRRNDPSKELTRGEEEMNERMNDSPVTVPWQGPRRGSSLAALLPATTGPSVPARGPTHLGPYRGPTGPHRNLLCYGNSPSPANRPGVQPLCKPGSTSPAPVTSERRDVGRPCRPASTSSPVSWGERGISAFRVSLFRSQSCRKICRKTFYSWTKATENWTKLKENVIILILTLSFDISSTKKFINQRTIKMEKYVFDDSIDYSFFCFR